MERDELFKLVDTILNKTSEADLEVIREALKRREERSASARSHTERQFSPDRMAGQVSNEIAQQFSYSRESIRALVQNFAADIIRQNAPELTDEQVQQLISEWVPNPEEQQNRPEKGSRLPSDVLITMAQQFISFAQGSMPPSQQQKLNEEFRDWYKSYWEWFPSQVREALALYLKDVISEDDCWEQIYAAAGESEAGQGRQ